MTREGSVRQRERESVCVCGGVVVWKGQERDECDEEKVCACHMGCERKK